MKDFFSFPKNWESLLVYFLLIIPFALYLYFGAGSIANFMTTDEDLWISDPYTGRVQQYYDALGQKDWPKTRINDKPGVTVAMISGLGMLWEKNAEEKIIQYSRLSKIYNTDGTIANNYYFRFPVLLFNGLLGFLYFWLIKRLTENQWIALIATGLIWLFPVTLGISQIVNPDSVLWSTSFVAFLAFLVYLKKSSLADAIIASIFLGLALASKYSAIILFIYLFVASALYFLFCYDNYSDGKELRKKIFQVFLGYIFIIAGAIGVFAVLMPSALIDLDQLYKSTLGFKGSKSIFPLLYAMGCVIIFLLLDAAALKSFLSCYILRYTRWLRYVLPAILYSLLLFMFGLVIINWTFGNNFLKITDIPYDIGRLPIFGKLPFKEQIVLEFRPIVFSLTPLVLIGMAIQWGKSIFKKSRYSFITFVLSLFIIVFYYAIIKQKLLVHIRYSIILYPILILIATLSLEEVFHWKRFRVPYMALVYLFCLFAGVISLLMIQPFYFNYTNDILPKNQIITGAWGYGGYQAAEYLNAVPGSNQMTVWSDDEGFCQFFAGKCVRGGDIKWYKGAPLDYMVKTRRGSMNNESVWKTYDGLDRYIKTPYWKLQIDDREENFVEIYKTKAFPSS